MQFVTVLDAASKVVTSDFKRGDSRGLEQSCEVIEPHTEGQFVKAHISL